MTRRDNRWLACFKNPIIEKKKLKYLSDQSISQLVNIFIFIFFIAVLHSEVSTYQLNISSLKKLHLFAMYSLQFISIKCLTRQNGNFGSIGAMLSST